METEHYKECSIFRTTIKGLGYYETSLNSLVKTFAEKFNEMNKAPDGTARPLFEKIDPNADWSAENIKIADGWANGSYGITASKNEVGGDIGSTANENIIAMIKALEDSQSFKGGEHDTEFFNGSFYDCFANIQKHCSQIIFQLYNRQQILVMVYLEFNLMKRV